MNEMLVKADGAVTIAAVTVGLKVQQEQAANEPVCVVAISAHEEHQPHGEEEPVAGATPIVVYAAGTGTIAVGDGSAVFSFAANAILSNA